MSMTQKAKTEVEEFLARGEKLAAVKHLHNTYHFSLIQSKILVDAMEGRYVAASGDMLPDEAGSRWDEAAKSFVDGRLQKGKKIEAVAYVKKTFGISLKEAKDLVEDLDALIRPDQRTDNAMPMFAKIILLAFGLPGVIMLAIAGYQTYSQHQALEKSALTTGRVVSLNTRDGMTAPVIEYEWNGQQWLHASTTYSSPPAYAINESVPLYVSREDPQDIIIDTFMGRWFLISVLGGLGIFFTGIPLLAGVLTRRRIPRARLTRN